MPIIKAKQKQEKEQIRISIEKPILEKVRQYCEWANISKPDEFFEQAAEIILSKDKDWIVHYNSLTERQPG
jgi:hypothetical protein